MAKKPVNDPKSAPLILVHGEESILVRQRAKAVFDAWCVELGGMDHERIDAGVANSGEALRALGRLREALQTLPFFGTGKVVWFEGCNFLGDERTSQVAAVTEALAGLAAELAAFDWRGVRVVVSAGKVDKRRIFYKTLERLGSVEEHAGLSAGMKDWEARAEALVQEAVRGVRKEIAPGAAAALVTSVGPNLGQLLSEVEKLALYVGERPRIESGDVTEISVRNKQARAFALGDALGERDLGALLRALDEELWESRGGGSGGEIGLLYGLIAKMRALLLAKELVLEGSLRAGADYYRFKAGFEKLSADRFGSDRRFNPRLMNAYVMYRAAQQAENYTRDELVRGLERLLECGLDLMSSALDEGIVLQRALVEIAQRPGRAGLGKSRSAGR